MAATHVQHKDNRTAVLTALSVTFDNPVGAGNTVVGAVAYDGATDLVTSIVDDQSNSYTKIDSLLDAASDGRSIISFYCKNIINAPDTVTVNFSSGPAHSEVHVREAGSVDADPLDKHTAQVQINPGTGTDAITSGTQSTTTDGQYIAGFVFDPFTTRDVGWTNPGTGFSNFDDIGEVGNTYYLAGESLIQGSAGSIAATFTQASAGATDYGVMLVTLKAAAGVGRGLMLTGVGA